MDKKPQIDLEVVAHSLKLSVDQIRSAVQLMDDENTIPFIARYRRDVTSGLYESQLRRIREQVERARALAERKEVVSKSIESQGGLTEEIKAKINKAKTSRELEDVYIPFKPQKQTLASIAKQKGLEPLAKDLLESSITPEELPARLEQFVRVEKGLESVDDVNEGVHHLLVESFAQSVDVRHQVRKIFTESGLLVAQGVESESSTTTDGQEKDTTAEAVEAPSEESVILEAGKDTESTEANSSSPESTSESESTTVDETEIAPDESTESTQEEETPTVDTPAAEINEDEVKGDESSDSPKKAKKKKKKKKKAADHPFTEFENFSEPIRKLPPHRVLAINRGERAEKLKTKIESKKLDVDQLVSNHMVKTDHPFKDFLKKAARDALVKMIVPAVEREVRRDLTERAENHAVRVFTRNLRQLLVQRPVPRQKILAIDPGFRTGCKVAVVDETGKPVEIGRFFVVGKQERLDEAKQLVTRLVTEHQVKLIGIGNGSGCRAAEQFVSDLLANELKESSANYVIVNQAGAAAYSTSEAAREELPDHEPIYRSAISIARRLLDPLSELVKISPSNIGVGMYQHDIRAKHLQDSLDDEVESSVNFVGVDLNTASVTLLRSIAGLNQMTARRIVDFRNENGAFKNRRQLKEVQGIGDKTFTQCAGFLRVFDGEVPLDATPIHPESYEVAEKLLAKVGASAEQLVRAADDYSRYSQSVEPDSNSSSSNWHQFRKQIRDLDLQATADELGVGKWMLEDLVRCLMRPSRDPRHDFQLPIQRRSILSVDQLEVNKELKGQVVNVVDFGVFVDIGLGTSSLIHISQLSNKFIHDLHLAFSIGDILTVWVTEIDKAKKQVKLTALRPAGVPSGRAKRRFDKPRQGEFKRKKGHFNRRRPAKPKPPPKPISQEMVEGKEPMRSFSDLAQFFDKKADDPNNKK